ncbi:MAG: fibronectin type III domain-containing protein, partial [Firmicutes bacterium]|nr:fibronectin type III domain-containing protein [Bacillota bacterium]
ADYSSAKALEYAKANTVSDSQSGADCVKFVRACVEAGGVPRDTSRSYGYTSKQYMDYLVENDWVEVYELETSVYYPPHEGFPTSLNQGKIAPGDIFLYHCNNADCPKPDFHVTLAGTDKGNYEGKYYGFWTYYHHNKSNGKPTVVANKTALKIKCSKCGAAADTTTVYVLHFKSKENGYITYDESAANLEVVRAAKDTATLTWEAAPTAQGYKVYRSTSKTGTYEEVADVKELTYTEIVPKLGKTYYYKVKPYKTINGKVQEGEFTAYDSVSFKAGKPVIKVKKSSSTSATISWEPVEYADGYRIYRATSKNGTYKSVKTITDPEKLSWKNTKLTKGKTYYYKVKAFVLNGETKSFGSYSSYKSVKLK